MAEHDPAAYIREYYGVPAETGRRITVDGQPAEIIGFDGAHLLIRHDDSDDVFKAHPTWRVDYNPDHILMPFCIVCGEKPTEPGITPHKCDPAKLDEIAKRPMIGIIATINQEAGHA